MSKPIRVATARPRIATADLRAVKLAPKVADDHYSTPGHKAWRAEVIKRAGYRCQVCGISGTRLYADHIVELRDGGAALDPANGQALCPSHHTSKTLAARAERHRAT